MPDKVTKVKIGTTAKLICPARAEVDRCGPAYEKGAKGKYQLVVSNKSWNKLKQNLKPITRKTTPASIAERVIKLKMLAEDG